MKTRFAYLSVLLLLAMMFTLTGCGASGDVNAVVDKYWSGWSTSNVSTLSSVFASSVTITNVLGMTTTCTGAEAAAQFGDPTEWDGIQTKNFVRSSTSVSESAAEVDGVCTVSMSGVTLSINLTFKLVKQSDGWKINSITSAFVVPTAAAAGTAK